MTDKPDESSKTPSNTPKTVVSKKKAAKKAVADKPAAKKTTASKKKTTKKADVDKPAARRPAVKNQRMGGAAGRRSEDKVMPGLLQNLQGVFDKIHHDNRDQDQARDVMARDFNIQLQRSFKSMHKELEEREKILDRRLKSIDHTHNFEIKRFKLMSIPLMILTLVALFYLFYVVRVMEIAMSSMSQDMNQMTSYMAKITEDTHALSINTELMVSNTGAMVSSVDEMNTEIGAMNGNVSNLNHSITNLTVDVHHMTRTVAPTMKGINRFIP